MADTRTAVGIVGAGPAGLLLGHLLHRAGIDSITVEICSEEHVIERVRAGVLEQATVDLLHDVGLGDRLSREGLRHEGIYLGFAGERHRVDLSQLTGGRAITVYGQNKVVADLIAARRAAGARIIFSADAVALSDLDTSRPRIRVRAAGATEVFSCDLVAGCDGFHGVCRTTVPPAHLRTYEHHYPYGWLGILARAAPSSRELVYARHDRGFALFSMRTPEVTRLYLQCRPDERLDDWSDERIWHELRLRLRMRDGWEPNQGPILQKSVTGMRSFVVEPMRYGQLFLAGDAAHIVPPTGAKGMNLAVADVWRLARAIVYHHRTGDDALLNEYSANALRRVWRAQRFSCWMTALLHRHAGCDSFEERRQIADLEYLISSRAAMASLAENYAGLPLE